jgi:hypothetical protein
MMKYLFHHPTPEKYLLSKGSDYNPPPHTGA